MSLGNYYTCRKILLFQNLKLNNDFEIGKEYNKLFTSCCRKGFLRIKEK